MTTWWKRQRRAGANRARLAAFYQRIPAGAVAGGVAAMEIIPCLVWGG